MWRVEPGERVWGVEKELIEVTGYKWIVEEGVSHHLEPPGLNYIVVIDEDEESPTSAPCGEVSGPSGSLLRARVYPTKCSTRGLPGAKKLNSTVGGAIVRNDELMCMFGRSQLARYGRKLLPEEFPSILSWHDEAEVTRLLCVPRAHASVIANGWSCAPR